LYFCNATTYEFDSSDMNAFSRYSLTSSFSMK
jgi:hypothetical protein